MQITGFNITKNTAPNQKPAFGIRRIKIEPSKGRTIEDVIGQTGSGKPARVMNFLEELKKLLNPEGKPKRNDTVIIRTDSLEPTKEGLRTVAEYPELELRRPNKQGISTNLFRNENFTPRSLARRIQKLERNYLEKLANKREGLKTARGVKRVNDEILRRNEEKRIEKMPTDTAALEHSKDFFA